MSRATRPPKDYAKPRRSTDRPPDDPPSAIPALMIVFFTLALALTGLIGYLGGRFGW